MRLFVCATHTTRKRTAKILGSDIEKYIAVSFVEHSLSLSLLSLSLLQSSSATIKNLLVKKTTARRLRFLKFEIQSPSEHRKKEGRADDNEARLTNRARFFFLQSTTLVRSTRKRASHRRVTNGN